mmetsp:Transcript_48293/g.134869  ORF Transcript_48293/g.134869 Transcript_48293/m.134869 type:complete len:242 (+) Transcript_48293:860-1585(+)
MFRCRHAARTCNSRWNSLKLCVHRDGPATLTATSRPRNTPRKTAPKPPRPMICPASKSRVASASALYSTTKGWSSKSVSTACRLRRSSRAISSASAVRRCCDSSCPRSDAASASASSRLISDSCRLCSARCRRCSSCRRRCCSLCRRSSSRVCKDETSASASAQRISTCWRTVRSSCSCFRKSANCLRTASISNSTSARRRSSPSRRSTSARKHSCCFLSSSRRANTSTSASNWRWRCFRC